MSLMKYAVIKAAGKQYRVQEGDEIVIDKIEGKKGKKITFNKVLLLVNGKKVRIGTPQVAKAKVTAEILSQGKGEKIRVATYKAKSRYRRVKGFRPFLTRLKIKKIVG